MIFFLSLILLARAYFADEYDHLKWYNHDHKSFSSKYHVRVNDTCSIKMDCMQDESSVPECKRYAMITSGTNKMVVMENDLNSVEIYKEINSQNVLLDIRNVPIDLVISEMVPEMKPIVRGLPHDSFYIKSMAVTRNGKEYQCEFNGRDLTNVVNEYWMMTKIDDEMYLFEYGTIDRNTRTETRTVYYYLI